MDGTLNRDSESGRKDHRPFIISSNLGRRIALLVGTSMLLILAALAISGWLAVQQSSERLYQERQALAHATGKYLDNILGQNLQRLESVRFARGVDIEDADLEPEKRALHSTYLGSIFDEGVFITDVQGNVLWAEPAWPRLVGSNLAEYSPVQQTLSTMRPTVSNVITLDPSGRQVVFMITPLRNQAGKLVGLVGGQIDPLGRTMEGFATLTGLGKESYFDVIDSNGVVVASSDPRRILRRQQEVAGREAEITVSAPLSLAPWSMAIRQSESVAMAPIRTMERRFIIFGLSSLVLAFAMSLGMARSLVKPVHQLTTAARNISQGNLAQPVPDLGDDEIGQLGRSLESMRTALRDSLEEIQRWNQELEAEVEKRTRQLEVSYREIERKEAARTDLLRKVLTAQEEERKRIARELHDETTQALAALVMRLEAASASNDEARTREMMAGIKGLAVKTIENVHKVIFDLRPSALDDLGLLSALRWYAETRMGKLGIKTSIEVTGEERKLSPEVEAALFRVVQEAITNIVKHAEAQSVVLSVEFGDDLLRIEVEDDGQGFDTGAVNLQPDEAKGLGLLGMRERVTLLGGQFDIESQPGNGTHITVEMPLHREVPA
ncbi:MAG: HAMP domain-containing protein [Chloroflexi bacterium]|nr:HAMP domain-containing protein [Chloroflexota bacterium]